MNTSFQKIAYGKGILYFMNMQALCMHIYFGNGHHNLAIPQSENQHTLNNLRMSHTFPNLTKAENALGAGNPQFKSGRSDIHTCRFIGIDGISESKDLYWYFE
jgi:hypothetical protein